MVHEQDYDMHILEEGVDICGEDGEYHSLAHDGPCFIKPLPYRVCGIHEEMENIFLDVRE